MRLAEPQWVDKLPHHGANMCYFIIGYGCVFIGESGDGSTRHYSTLKKRKWANLFLWVDLSQIGVHDKICRKHLEALLIFWIAQLYKKPGSTICVKNTQYTKSLGRFSEKARSTPDIAIPLFTIFVNYLRSNEDPRGNHNADTAIWFDEATDSEVRWAAYKRRLRILSGRDRVGFKKVKCYELRLDARPRAEEGDPLGRE